MMIAKIKPLSILSLTMMTATLSLPVWGESVTTCVKTNEQEIAGLFDRWNKSLATLDPDKVVANYAPEAVLLPTVSNKPRTNPTEIREYFVDFLKNKPQGVIDFRVIKINCNVASDTGLYTFTLYDEKGEAQKVAARYSYVYEYLNGQWVIEHHHSSAMPEPNPAK